MAKKITLEGLAKLITDLGTLMKKGFAKHGKEIHDLTESVAHVVKHMATKDDIAEVHRDMARKEQIVALHMQVNSIETQLRGMKNDKLETRVKKLEEEVFGHTRR